MNLWYYIEIIQAVRNLDCGYQAATFIGNKKVLICPLLARVCAESSPSEILLKDMPGERSKSQVLREEEVETTQSRPLLYGRRGKKRGAKETEALAGSIIL
jgi:hypothetical protein